MISLTLKQLRYLDALAKHAHFGHAAEACAISQPALSMQIKELEAILGLELIERTPRKVRLTEFGTRFVARARDVLSAVDDLGEMARAAQDQLMGRLRLGVIPTIAPYMLPRLIRGLAASHPALDVHVRETQTHKLMEEVDAGHLDAAILALPVPAQGLTAVPLFRERFVFVRPRADADQPVPDAARLREMRLLLLEEGHCFREQALAFCDAGGGGGREALDASSLSTLVQMVDAGIGVTLIPEMAVAVETRSANVDVARFGGREPERTVGMIWRASSPLAAQLQDIAAVVRTLAPPGQAGRSADT